VAELGEEPDAIEQRCRAEMAAGYDDDLAPRLQMSAGAAASGAGPASG
jgi:hypothetical protein